MRFRLLRLRLPFLFFSLLWSASPRINSQEHLPDDIHRALLDWRAAHGQNWQLVYDEVAQQGRMLLGGGANAPFQPRNAFDWWLIARFFVTEAFPVLRIAPESLTEDRMIELPLSQIGTTDKIALRLRQSVQGVPVERGWVDVLFEQGTGILLAIDSQALRADAGLDLTALLDPPSARDVGKATFAAETGTSAASTREPRPVILQRDDAGSWNPVLAWQVDVAGTLADGRPAACSYYVAARTGTVLRRTERIHEAAQEQPRQERTRVTANVTADGCCFRWDDGTNRVAQPMPNMTVEFPDGSTTTTDAEGSFPTPLTLFEEPVRLSFHGPFVVVHNHEVWSEGDLQVQESLELGLTRIQMNPLPAERDVAQANAFLRVDQMRSWVRRTNPADATMDSSRKKPGFPYQLVTNWVIPWGVPGTQRGTAPCNALFDAYHGVIRLSISGAAYGKSCPNASFAPIVWHEMGHWLNQLYGSDNDYRGFGEGNADVFAMYQMDQPELAYGSVGRSGENTLSFCGDCASRQGCLGDVHLDGLPLMGALWKVRRNLQGHLGRELGGSAADALFLGWMNAFDQGLIHSIIEWQWLVLDDDDHDLSNLTPRLVPIDDAFRAQGFPGYRLPVTTVICR